MKQQIRVTTVPTSDEKVGTCKPLISNDETTVPTVPTCLGHYAGGSSPPESMGVLKKGGFGGYGGYSNFLQVRPQRSLGVNDGGHVVGEDHHRARLTDHDVWLIRELHDEGLSYRQIAIKFEVSRSTVESICQGRRRAQTATGQKARRT